MMIDPRRGDTLAALEYALALVRGRLDVEAPYHQAFIRQYVAALESLLAASGGASSGWQPIETAPKDGTPVLVAGHGDVSFATYHEWQFTPEQLARCRGGTPASFAGWCDDYSGVALNPQPTLWFDVPAPPSGGETPQSEGE